MQTIRELRQTLKFKQKTLKTWRAVAEVYRITPAMAWRIANTDYEPRDSVVRHRLGLPSLVKVPPCPECGELHTVDECTQGKRVIVKDAPKPRKPRNRRAVNLDDPQSAAATLRKHANAEFVAALVKELERIE